MNPSRANTSFAKSQTGITHHLLRSVEYACWFAGAFALAWFVVGWLNISSFQELQAKRFERLRHKPTQAITLRAGDPFGKISIPRIGLSAMIAEGIDDGTLRHAVGHFPESSIPEGAGTVALAGHRDTFFRGLARVRLNDLIELETPRGRYEYRVIRTAVVSPEHIELVQPSSGFDLTLVTCFPFHYVGPAPQRFIVQALRLRSQTR